MVRRVAPSIGAVVPPRPDRWHATPTPTLGGVAIAAGTLCGSLLLLFAPGLLGDARVWAPVPLAALAMFAVGVLDDRLQLSPIAKLVASLAIGAFLALALVGVEPGSALPSWSTVVAIVWFGGICHAINLLDNMDGLAAGIALIATCFCAWLLGGAIGAAMVVVLTSLAGALLGFLYWNRPAARLFMGDAGSLFIGAMLGASTLLAIFNTRIAFISPAVI